MDNPIIKPEVWIESLEIQNYSGECPIHIAASEQNEILIKYCSSDASIRIRDHRGELPIHRFFHKKPTGDSIFDIQGCLKTLIGDKNWKLMEKINFEIGYSPLHKLFNQIQPEEHVPFFIKDLLNEDNLNVFDFKGLSPVHICKNLKIFQISHSICKNPILDLSGRSYVDAYEKWEKAESVKSIPQKMRKFFFMNEKKGIEIFDDFIKKNVKNNELKEYNRNIDSSEEDDLSEN